MSLPTPLLLQDLAVAAAEPVRFSTVGDQHVARESGANLVLSLAGKLGDDVADIVDIEDVVAEAARHRVGAGAAVERSSPPRPNERVVAAEAVQHVVVGGGRIGRAVIAVE